MPTTYDAAIDAMFGIAKAIFDVNALAILGYVPDVRYPGAPLGTKPDRSRLWARVSSQIVTDGQASLTNALQQRMYEADGLLYIQLFCPRNVGASIDKGRLIAKALQTSLRKDGLNGEIWFRKAKILELPESEESYPITVSAEFTYKTLQ